MLMGTFGVTIARGVQAEVDAFQNHGLVPLTPGPMGPLKKARYRADSLCADVRGFTWGSATRFNVAVANGNTLQRVTTEGDDQLAKIALGAVRAVHWTSQEGIALEASLRFRGLRTDRRYRLWCSAWRTRVEYLLQFSMFPGCLRHRLCCAAAGICGSTDMHRLHECHLPAFGDRAMRRRQCTDFAIAQSWADPVA